jgi:hypothetical protein
MFICTVTVHPPECGPSLALSLLAFHRLEKDTPPKIFVGVIPIHQKDGFSFESRPKRVHFGKYLAPELSRCSSHPSIPGQASRAFKHCQRLACLCLCPFQDSSPVLEFVRRLASTRLTCSQWHMRSCSRSWRACRPTPSTLRSVLSVQACRAVRVHSVCVCVCVESIIGWAILLVLRT